MPIANASIFGRSGLACSKYATKITANTTVDTQLIIKSIAVIITLHHPPF